MTAVTQGLMGSLDALECSDADRAYILARGLLLRAQRARARAVALAGGSSGRGSARLRRLAGAAMALGEASDALECAERLVRLLGSGR